MVIDNTISLALLVFLILLWFTRSPQKLSAVLFGLAIAEIAIVILYFTTRFNNIVIVKDIAAQVIGYTMILLWLAHLPNHFRLAATPMNPAVLIFLLASVFSALTTAAQFRHAALIRLSLPVSAILTFWVIANFFSTRRRWTAAVFTLQGLMVVTAVYSILQERGYDFMNWGRIVNVSTFGNVQFFANFLSYMAPLSVFLALGAKEWMSRIICLSFAALCIAELVHTQMRGGYLCLILLGILLVYFELRFGRVRRLIGTRPGRRAAWAAVFVLSMIFFTASPGKIQRTFETIFYNNEGFHSIRTLRMTGGVMMGWDRPVVGHGIGTFHAVFPYYRDSRYHRVGLSHNNDSPASQLVALFGEQGLLGLSAFLAVLVVFFVCMMRHIRKKQDLSERYAGFGILAAVLCGWVPDGVGHGYLWMTSTLTFWVLLGLGTRWMMGLEEPPVESPAEAPADSATAGVPEIPEMPGGEIRPESPRIETGAPVVPERAMDGPQAMIYFLLVCVFFFMVWAHAHVLRGDWLLKKCEDAGGQEAIELCRTTIEIQPYAHSAYYRLAYHQINRNEMAAALESYNLLLGIAPNYAQTHQNTGLIYYRMFSNTNRRRYLHQTILEFEWATLLENSCENHTKLLQLHTQLGNDSARGRHHNQFLWWNVREDAFLNLSRYWNVAGDPARAESKRRAARDEWVGDLHKYTTDYWLYRTDIVRRVGRPMAELRYVMKMAAGSATDHSELAQYTIGALIGSGQDEDFMYLADILERLKPGVVPEDVESTARAKLAERRRGRF